jgi:hypothetical protein
MRLAKSMRLLMGATLLALLSVWTFNTTPSTYAWGRPIDLDMSGVSCSGVNCQTFEPNIVGTTNYVHLVYINNNNQSIYYHRGRTDGSGNVAWERGKVIATSVKSSDDGVDMVVDASNTIHLAYSSGKTVYYMRAPNEAANGWTGAERVESPGARLNNLDIALDADGNPYIAWAQGINPSYLGYAYRRSGGNWVTDRIGGSRQYLHKNPKIVVHGGAANATIHIFAESERKENGDFFIAYARGTAGGDIAVSNWSYAFSSPDESDNSPYATYDAVTGHIYAGYVDRMSNGRYVWAFSRSTDNGVTWEDLRNVSFGSSFWAGLSPMVAHDNMLYIMNSVKEIDKGTIKKIGIYDIRFNARTNSFTEFQPILNYADSNHQVPTNENGLSYGFSSNTKVAVWIRNWTNGPGYNADPGGIQNAVSPKATLRINNGAGSTNSKTLKVSFSDVIGEPNQMRVAVNKPLDGVQPTEFRQNFTVEATDQVGCVSTVRVELINNKGLKSDILEAKIVVDSEVSATTYVGNPYKATNSRVYSSIQQTDPDVNDGDANYTREKIFYVQIGDAGECSKLETFRYGASANSLLNEFGIVNNSFVGVLALPGLKEGDNTVVLQVKDSVGNVKNIEHNIVYDPKKPTLTTAGTVTAEAGPADASILTKLTFSGNQVTDNLYPGRGFWGVLIANSRTPVNDPINSQSLKWSVVRAPGSSSDFTINNWSVLSGIPANDQKPGDYYIYVRFVDGAGNVSDEYIETSISLDTITKPKVHLPLVRK